MPSDGGFEGDLVNDLIDDKTEIDEFHPYRRKQHRFSSQDIDVLIDSKDPELFYGVECKSKQVDVEKTEKDNNSTEDKIYFSQAFSTDKQGVSQVKRITQFLHKTGRTGALAVAYRRGRGRSVHYYGIHWSHVWNRFKQGESGIPKQFMKENGVLLMDAESEEKVKRGTPTDFTKIFNVEGVKSDYSEAFNEEI